MLIKLTPNKAAIKRKIANHRKYNSEFKRFHVQSPHSNPEFILEKGIYFMTDTCFDTYLFKDFDGMSYEEIHRFDMDFDKSQYGVADNLEQIKHYFRHEITDKTKKYVIVVSTVYQDKQNKCGFGWKWGKNGKYIGNLNPQCTYLDDEDFGKDFKFVLTFQLLFIK